MLLLMLIIEHYFYSDEHREDMGQELISKNLLH